MGSIFRYKCSNSLRYWVAVALMFENSPGLMDGGTDMLDDLKQWIVDSSLMRPGQEDHDDHYGYGLLQVDALISASQGDTT